MKEKNNPNLLIAALREALERPLPGDLAHQKMASYKRPSANALKRKQLGHKRAGVLVNLFLKEERWHITLIQRPDYEGTHSGQVAFPGGKHEPTDKNIVETAIREANEEVGIEKNNIQLLGQLSDIYIPPSNFLVSPSLAFHEKEPEYFIDPKEVKEAFDFPVELLFQEQHFTVKRIYLPYYRMHINAPVIAYEGKTIWGATAMMLSEFKEVLAQAWKLG